MPSRGMGWGENPHPRWKGLRRQPSGMRKYHPRRRYAGMLLNWYLKSRRSLAQQSPQIGSSTIGKDATAYITHIVSVHSTISPSALRPRNRLPASSPMPLVATGINCFHVPANPRAVVVRTGATLGGKGSAPSRLLTGSGTLFPFVPATGGFAPQLPYHSLRLRSTRR